MLVDKSLEYVASKTWLTLPEIILV